MRTIIVGIALLLSFIAQAQRECASATYLDAERRAQAGLDARLQSIEDFIQSARMARGQGNDGLPAASLIRIPVVVHILYNTPDQNLSDQQVRSQLDALNRDFRRLNADSANTPLRFKGLAADTQIEFALATADPLGRPTTGIVRKKTTVTNWTSDDKIKYANKGGSDAWDSRYYLNIWVGHSSSTLGYATAPGMPADKDGVMIATTAFGTIGRSGPFNLGRTAVHEVGHWLGLKHIWGDYYCGEDGVEDTPKQGNFTSGCPTVVRYSCNNNATGDMYMNYMDYTNDACMNLFTLGQRDRMRSLFLAGGPRNSLLSSKGLLPPWTEEAPLPAPPVEIPEEKPRLFPNPATAQVILELPESWVGANARIYTSDGILLSQTRISSRQQKIPVGSYRSGLYFIEALNGQERLKLRFVKQ
jgi:hypothetical protein